MRNEKSCGCIIINDGKVLLIEQANTGTYNFPKGHMNPGETEIETATREVKEETNLDVIINSKLRFSLSYVQKNIINKEVVYYVAKAININEIKAQEKEIKQMIWVDINKVYDTLTFDNLKEIWNNVLKKI